METEIEEAEEPPGKHLFNVSEKEWNDWQWQFRNKITSLEEIRKITGEDISFSANLKFPMSITPYYFSLIQKYDYTDPLFSMCVPNDLELNEIMLNDPLCEDEMMPVENLVHRYRDRALLITTNCCFSYCRYCTRKRRVATKDHCMTSDVFENILKYLREHSEIKDVIISGGDPFILETHYLENIIKSLREIKSIDIIRIGTKTPVVLPQRITDSLVFILKKYHPIFVNTHFNHPNEVTKESIYACEKLVDNGFVVGNQSVLLKGINDDKIIYETLCRKLVKMRVRPYYLFQCDIVNGVEHFRTKVSKGIEIMEHLRGRLSGLAIPQFVIDSPGGYGKIPILPNYIVSSDEKRLVLKNYQGIQIEYPEV